MQFRHEHKHYINYLDYLVLRRQLKVVMQPDVNTDEAGEYHIRSLYFDNYRDVALQDKISGINHREKFRIRCYNKDFAFINLEKKIKSMACVPRSRPILQRGRLKRFWPMIPTGWLQVQNPWWWSSIPK